MEAAAREARAATRRAERGADESAAMREAVAATTSVAGAVPEMSRRDRLTQYPRPRRMVRRGEYMSVRKCTQYSAPLVW